MLLKKYFRHYYLKYGWAFVLGILVLVAVDWFQLDIPRIFKTIVDQVENGVVTELNQIISPLWNITLIVMGMTLGRFLWRFLLIGTSRKIETDIRSHLFRHATTLDQPFYATQKVGGLMAYFTNDLNAVRELFGFGLLMLVDGLFLGSFVLIRMLRLNWLMTIYAFIPIALMGILIYFLEKRMEAKFNARQEAFEKMSDFTQESFSGITVIKAYVREIAEIFGFRKRSQKVYETSMNHLKYVVVVNMVVEVMISLVILAIIAYGSLLIAYGQLSSGELTEYISYFFTLLWPVIAISMFLNINAQAQASAKRLTLFLDSKPLVSESIDIIQNVTFDGSIQVEHLTFMYPDAKTPILKDVSFHIQSGEFVGVLGKTGSGKSTLVELLLKTYYADSNMIYFGPYDAAKLSVKTVRDQMGYVPQDNFLFSDTIENNIGFALPEKDRETVVKAAQLSDIHDNISQFKDQYDTVLGERGVTVSGGQKQRISIARALAKNPPILILDDAVSAVDTKTEEAIISNLRKIRQGKTTIFVAHRISTVKKLDKILLLDQGQVIGFGSHKELLESSALYREMVALQDLEALVGEVAPHA